MGRLQIEIERQQNGSVVRLIGPIESDDESQLQSEFQRLAMSKPAVVAVDLSGVTFLSSVGIAALVMLHRTLKQQGGTVRIVSPPANIAGVLGRAHIVEMMPVFETLDRAMR